MSSRFSAILGLALALPVISASAFSISPLAGFSPDGDGWLNTNEFAGLTMGNNERGLAFGNGSVYLVSGTSVRVLNAMTGAQLTTLDVTGIAGGARALNTIGVGSDGRIYGANLSTALANTTAGLYRVYRWDNNSATPTQIYSGVPLTGARLGDSFDVFGAGANTRLVAGYAASPAITGNNGFVVIEPDTATATHVSFPATPPAAGDFRLGLTFGPDATTIIGDQGNVAADTRLVSYSGGSGSLLSTLTLNSANERQMDYAVVNGLSLLATIETGSVASSSTVRIYDVSTLSSPILLGSARAVPGAVAIANGNGSGGVAWGDIISNGDGTSTAYLYAMDSNEGLQAFSVVVPEPGTGSLLLLGLGALALRRRVRQ